MKIPFNKPFFTGKEPYHMQMAAIFGQISGNGAYTKKCHQFFEKKFGFGKALLTTSCSDALEMAAILSNVGPGDEVILPSFTFVSTANAFALRGATLVFADVEPGYPNLDPAEVEKLITPRTRAIVLVHYAGVACRMDEFTRLAGKHNLWLIEDAAHAIGSSYRKQSLGSIGHLATFSFHETKNIISGEGGLLAVNDKRLMQRAEIIWEKGTNRAAFYRGEVNKYGWVDVGSSFLPSELIAAFLYAQLDAFKEIQKERIRVRRSYLDRLQFIEDNGWAHIPALPDYATDNGNMFFMIARNGDERDALLRYLNRDGIHAVFHYLPLHSSEYFAPRHDGRQLPNTDHFSHCIIRLPFFSGLTEREVDAIAASIRKFYTKK